MIKAEFAAFLIKRIQNNDNELFAFYMAGMKAGYELKEKEIASERNEPVSGAQ
jgi:hypothetical protein